MILTVFLLSGCETLQLKRDNDVSAAVITKTVYVYRKVPDEHLQIPDSPKMFNLENYSQRDVASWLIENEKYIDTLIINIRSIREWNINIDTLTNKQNESK
jgi:hypothetical protein